MTTPSMLLTLPTVSVTLGPAWASQLNVALEVIDLHDHTEDKGVKVPSAGLNINADLSFANNALLAVKHVGIATDSVDPAIAGAVYVKNGDLYYTATNLTPVQLTNGTSIQGVAGNISGLGDGGSTAAFNDFTEDFTFKFNSGDKHAALNIGEIRIYPFDGSSAYSDPITLKAPLSLATAYSLELPGTLPVADNVLSVTSAGVIKQGLGNGTVAVPSLGFESDPDSGIYRIGANNIGVAVNAAKVLDITTTGLGVTGTLIATGALSGASLGVGAGTIAGGALTVTSITCSSLTTDQPTISFTGSWSVNPATSTQQIKFAYITASLAGSGTDGTITLTSCTEIISVSGTYKFGSGLFCRPILNDSTGVASVVYFASPTDASSNKMVRIVNSYGTGITVDLLVAYY